MQSKGALLRDYSFLTDSAYSYVKWWGGFVFPTAFLFTLMCFGNVFEDVFFSALLWFCISTLPVPLLLFIKMGQPKDSVRLIFKPALKILQIFSLFYLLVLLLILLTSLHRTHASENSIEVILLQSLWVLLPWNILLILGVVYLFYRPHHFNPSSTTQEINTYVKQKAEDAKLSQNNEQYECLMLLANNQIEEAIKILIEKCKIEELSMKDLVLIQSRYKRIQKSELLNIEDPNTIDVSLNKIIFSLAEIIENHL